ncbi:hypothetical protein AltI4_30990 [Alteromonas sp. I4]|nr:hypothetical protein AltI4_30990 [Alteromonas sp. I4]
MAKNNTVDELISERDRERRESLRRMQAMAELRKKFEERAIQREKAGEKLNKSI